MVISGWTSFFCLSGFILSYVYFEEFSKVPLLGRVPKIREYLLRRFARIYPTYLLTTIIAGLFYVIAINVGHEFVNESGSNLSVLNAFLNILGVQAWVGIPSLNGPAWSVSAEFLAYILFPIFVFSFSRWILSSSYHAYWTLAVSIIWYEVSLHTPLFVEPRVSQVLSEFLMGLSVYVICKDLIAPKKLVRAARMFLSISLLLIFILVRSTIILQSVIPLLLLLLIGLNYFENTIGRGLGRKVLVNLGIWSYSLYLTHRLVQNLMSGTNFPKYEVSLTMRLIQVGALIAIPLLLAWGTTKFFENPCRRVILRLKQ
jgi:peptidoglycan/LPS O-acetylase OafA/YrhL